MEQQSLAKKKGIADIADIVVLIDVTGSMGKCIDALKHNIEVMVDSMINPGPNADSVVSDWRIKVAGYRDYSDDVQNWWVDFPFTRNVDEVKANLAKLEAKGGGDEPEGLLDALWMLARMPVTERGQEDGNSWRYRSDAARVVVVFTDASCHMTPLIPEAGGAGFEDVAREVMAAKLRISLFAPEADCYTQYLSQLDALEYETIGSLSDAPEMMVEFTSDPENFKSTLRALAKSISVSSVTPTL